MSTPDESAEHLRSEQAKARLRAALDGVELDPDETADDKAIRWATLDEQLKQDVPPHHVERD